MRIEDLVDSAREFQPKLAAMKAKMHPDFEWYRYSTMNNIGLLNQLLKGDYRLLTNFVRGSKIADIGAADGDLSFFLEQFGLQIDLIDNPATNHNSLKAARYLKQSTNSKVVIHEADLDEHFSVPSANYDLVFFLGILYHLKNPYYVLEHLARVTEYCFLSTRVTRFTRDRRTAIRDEPVAYLVGRTELNDDPTNFWIFSETGLRRILERTGWTVCCWTTFGNTSKSDPVTTEGDERAFCLIRSACAFAVREGWYPPHSGAARWVKQRAAGTILSAEQGILKIAGHVPADLFAKAYGGKLTVTVACQAEKRTVAVDAKGLFAVEVPVPTCKKLDFDILFDKSFVPQKIGTSQDDRELAAIVEVVNAT